MAFKRIFVYSLKIGMYVTRLDCPWYRSPFLKHRFLIRSQSQLDKLKRSGFQEVTIDSSRGLDIETPPHIAASDDFLASSRPPDSSGEPAPQPFYALVQDLHVAQEAREQLAQSVRTLFGQIGASGAVHKDEVQDVVREIVIVTRTLTNPAAFMAISRFSKLDPSLSDHALSVCALALILGKAVGCSVTALHHLATGALLHDVGLFQIPTHLRASARERSAQEQALYDSHCRLGALSLERQGFDDEVLRIVDAHHTSQNSIDPARHPTGSKVELSRIVGVVDRYHELVTGQFDAAPHPHLALSRLYQEAQMSRSGTELVSLFIKMIGVYPVYSFVELNTGERAIVTEISARQLIRPVITIVYDPKGNRYPVPLRIDLSSDLQEASTRSIVKTLDAEEEGFSIESVLGNQTASSPPT